MANLFIGVSLLNCVYVVHKLCLVLRDHTLEVLLLRVPPQHQTF